MKRPSACDVVKGAAGPPLDACLVKNELEAFLLYMNENMITKTVGRTNDQTCKVRRKINADEFLFHYSDKNEGEIKCLFGLLYFTGLYHSTKEPTNRAVMSLNRYECQMRAITFHDHNTVRDDFLGDRFACMRFEKNAWKYYRHTEFFVIDETLRNFYVLYNCDFKVYKYERQDKPGIYDLLFRVLAYAQDQYASIG